MNKLKKKDEQVADFAQAVMIVSMAIWAIAAFLPAYYEGSDISDSTNGLNAFLYGFILFLYPLVFIAWSANVLWLLTFYNLFKQKFDRAVTLATISVPLSVLSLLITRVEHGLISGGYVDLRFGPGALVWIASMVVALIGALLARRLSRIHALKK